MGKYKTSGTFFLTVNFDQDYKALLEAEPGQMQGIGLMISSSYTQSVTIAAYDDFVLLGAEEHAT